MHLVNEKLKRLEPTETKCAFCGIEHSKSMHDNYFMPLFRVQDRTNVVVYRSVKYQKIPVGLPRCGTCKDVHESSANKAKMYAWGAALVFIILCFAIWGIWGIFAIFGGIIIGFGGAELLESKFVRDSGVLTKKDGAKEDGTIQELVINGWSFTQPSA